MNDTIRTKIESLDSLRLPELQTRYAEVLGEETRCPNKRYLIRRITEALEAGGGEPAAADTAEAEVAGDTPAEPVAEPQDEAPTETTEAQADEADTAPNADGDADGDAGDDADQPAEPEAAAGDGGAGNGTRLTKLSVPELQALYLETVGRPTSSGNKRYVELADMLSRAARAARSPPDLNWFFQRFPSTTPHIRDVLPVRRDGPGPITEEDEMLESYVEKRFVLERFRSSPAGPYMDGFAEALLKSGYAWQTGASCLRHAVHVGRWSAAQSLAVEALDEDAIAEFEAHLGTCDCPYERAGSHERAGARVRVFLGYLREIGVAPPAPSSEDLEPERLVEFRGWMRRQRGSSDWTLRAYSRPVRGLIERLGEDPAQYGAQAIRRAVLDMAAGHGASKAQQVATATRMYLGFLAVTGRCSPHLADAVPRVARWSQTTLPKHLPAEDVDKLIASCDTATARTKLRDRAILLLLARLGLRADDVMSLRLGDIDWAEASFRVCGKGRREGRLPLPQDVGDAILAYLEQGRPRVPDDHVFLTARAPWRPIGNNATVANVVGRAIERAGVQAPSRGSHLLRHSAATTMLRKGASLPVIGAVLRHRTIETTKQYARVDGALLGQVVQPWPEAAELDDGAADDGAVGIDQLRSVAQPWPGEVSPC